MKYLLLFRCNNAYADGPQYYVYSNLPVLLITYPKYIPESYQKYFLLVQAFSGNNSSNMNVNSLPKHPGQQQMDTSSP